MAGESDRDRDGDSNRDKGREMYRETEKKNDTGIGTKKWIEA